MGPTTWCTCLVCVESGFVFVNPMALYIPVTPTTSILPKVLRYKWEAYCDTNGKSTESFLLFRPQGAPGIQQYKLEACCNTDWSYIAVLFGVVVVGVSDILPM